MAATPTPIKDDPARIVPAALPVGVGVAVEVTAAVAEPAALDEAALALLELMDEAAVMMPVGALAVEGATMIPPAAVAAVGATVVEALSESESEPEATTTSVAWMRV
jgi:hypothetical protein